MGVAVAPGGGPLLALARLQLQRLSLVDQAYAVLHETEVLVAPFGASMAWLPLLPRGSFFLELHPGPVEHMPHFGSCNTRGRGFDRGPWGANLRSEWGAWAVAAG